MLEEAHRRHDRGTYVVVGFVETYGRRHTAGLLDGLEVVPRRRVEYRGVAWKRWTRTRSSPAIPPWPWSTNWPHTTSRARPREALSRCGGDPLRFTSGTDCNVQHVESIADAVETILDVPVRERIPDEVVRAADEIELVDMSPHALRQRMRHGNVYPPDRATLALEKFFTEPNLNRSARPVAAVRGRQGGRSARRDRPANAACAWVP